MQKGGAGFFPSPFSSFEFIEDLLLMEKFAWHSTLLYFYTPASLFNLSWSQKNEFAKRFIAHRKFLSHSCPAMQISFAQNISQRTNIVA